MDLPEAIEQAAEALRTAWELGMNPVPNVHVMLETHGVKVKTLTHEDGFDGFPLLQQTVTNACLSSPYRNAGWKSRLRIFRASASPPSTNLRTFA